MTTGRSLDGFTRRWFIGGLADLGATAGRGLSAELICRKPQNGAKGFAGTVPA